MPPSKTTTPGNGQPTGNQTNRFNKAKTQMAREHLERGYVSMSDHIWYGMGDVWWAISHPLKAISRNIGQLCMVVVVASTIGASGYLLFDEGGEAQLSLEEPGSILKVAGDNTIRPATRWVRRTLGSAADAVDEQFDGDDYRE